MKAIVMAGGEGKRLRPLTGQRPKPLVPLLGKPVMGYTIDLLHAHGVYDIAATVSYMAADVRRAFGDSLVYFEEETPLGTAGGVAMAKEFLQSTFFVLSGDALTDIDLSAALAFHHEKSALATLVLTRVENPLEYGVVVTGRDGRIKRFVEKPDWRGVVSDTVNTGIYILEPEIFAHIPSGPCDFGKDLFPKLVQAGLPVYGCTLPGYWCDIGDIQSYMDAQRSMLEGRVRLRPGKKGALPDLRLGEGSRVLSPCYIGSGCVLGKNVTIGPGCVLGDHIYVGDSCELTRTILWEGASLDKNCRAQECCVLDGARIGAGAVLEAGSVVGSGAHVGEGSHVFPGVYIWPGRSVEDHAAVRRNVVFGDRAQFLHEGGDLSGQLLPEDAAALGAALQNAFGAENVAVASRTPGACSLLADAMAAGCASAGAQVLRMENASPAAALYGGAQAGCDVICHIETQQQSAKLALFDRQGSLSPAKVRKLRHAFAALEETRAPYDVAPSIRRHPYAQQEYDARVSYVFSLPQNPVPGDAQEEGFVLYDGMGAPLNEKTARAMVAEAVQGLFFESDTKLYEALCALDGNLALGVVGAYLAGQGMPYAALCQKHGCAALKVEIACPNRLKGAAMRRVLHSVSQSEAGEGGITVPGALAQATITPDAGPSLTLFVSSTREEYAKEFLQDMETIVRRALSDTETI